MGIFLTTTLTATVDDLGKRVFTHPTVSYNLIPEFTEDEIKYSVDLQSAINSGFVVIKDDDNNVITDLDQYGPHNHNSNQVAYDDPNNWNKDNVKAVVDQLTEHIGEIGFATRISPENPLSLGGVNQVDIAETVVDISYEGFYRHFTIAATNINTTGYAENTYYVYVDNTGTLQNSSTEPNRHINAVLGFFYHTGVQVGLVQQDGAYGNSFLGRVSDLFRRLGIFIYDDGSIQIKPGVSKLKIVSPACKAQAGTLSVDLPELDSDDVGINFFCWFKSADDGWDYDHFWENFSSGEIPTLYWNDKTQNSSTALSANCTFTNGSTNVPTAADLTLEVSVGDYVWLDADGHTYFNRVQSINATDITLEQNYGGAGGGAGASSVGKALPNLGGTKWVKHMVIRTLDGNMHLVLGQEEFNTETLAVEAGVPEIPSAISSENAKMAYFVVEQGETDLTGQIQDIRPLPFHRNVGGSQGGGIATAHSSLSGLGNDDHAQYLLTNGSRNLTGIQQYNAHPAFSADEDLIDKKYTDDGLATKSNTGHTHVAANVTDFDVEVSNNTDVAANTTARHSHTNKGLLDTLTSGGSGTNLLSDDGSYKAFSSFVAPQFTDMVDPTGFVDLADSTMSFVNGTLTFTIQPTGPSFDYYIAGVKYTKSTPQNKVISATEGLHYIYFDGATLTETTTFSIDLFIDKALCSIIYWDNANSIQIYFADERHGINMSGQSHTHFHFTRGTAWISGLALNGILADQSGDVNTHAQLGYDAGVIRDEDLQFSIAADPTPTQIPVYYKTGASGLWRAYTATNYPVRSYLGLGTNRLSYNQFTGGAWQETLVSNNDFVLSHIFATNDTSRPLIVIQGQAVYGNIASARTGAAVEINNLVIAGLPFAEFTPLGTVIFQTSDGYANAVRARIRSTGLGNDYVDFRQFTLASTGSTSDHGNLSGLGDDDHLQYMAMARAGDINGLTQKTVLAVADELVIEDSADSNNKKKIFPSALSSMLMFGNNSVLATTTTRYLSPYWSDTQAQTAVQQFRIPRAGIMQSLRVHHNNPAGNGGLIVYTLRVNNVASALTASVASTASDGSDLVNTVTVAAGDLIDLIVTKALGVGTSPSDIIATMEFV